MACIDTSEVPTWQVWASVLISNDLSWNEQVSKVAAKANTTLHFISRNLKHCPRSMRQTAYCSLTRSGMEYCSSVWDPHLQKDKVRLEKVNRRAARVVFNRTWRDPNVSPTVLLHQLQWAPPGDPQISPADVPYLCTRYHTGLLQCHPLVLSRQLEILEDIRENTSTYPPPVIRLNFLSSHGAYLNGIN